MDCDDDGAPKQSTEDEQEPVKENKLLPVPSNVANLPSAIYPANQPSSWYLHPTQHTVSSSSRQSVDYDMSMRIILR